MHTLTPNQKKVLTFISGFIKTRHYPPTFREIAEYNSITVKGVSDYLEALKRKGYIKTSNEQRSRSIEVLKGPDGGSDAEFLEVPVIGAAAANAAEHEVAEARAAGDEAAAATVRIHKSWVKKPNTGHFALIARGDSMTGAGILDGDMAIIMKQETAKNGDIIAAEIDDGFTLKRYFRENARIRLQPENAAYKPLYCGQVHIAGVLACVYRSY